MENLLVSCMLLIAVVTVGQGQDPLPKPIIKSLHINTNINYTYANTLVSSRILNPADAAQEVNFRVVLPEEAFITGLIMTIKGESYTAYIKEKEEAKKEYDAAVSAGRGAAHVFQNSRFAKDFTVSVNVEPHDKVNFNLTYEELLSRKNKTYKNEINVNPNQIVDDLSIVVNIEDVLPLTDVHVPEFIVDNNIMGSEKTSAKVTEIAPNKYKVEWNPNIEEQAELKKEGLNGKMIVKYDVDASKHPQQILVDSDGYFVHILRNDDLPVLNKHVVFVLDVSGSMSGSKIQQLKDAMEKILLDLSESDFFSIILFSVEVVAWGPESPVNLNSLNGYNIETANVMAKDDYVVPATKSNVQAALEFIKTLNVYGGTNIMGGLRNGLKIAKLGQKKRENSTDPIESMMIFLTDGQPNAEESDPEKITENVQSQNNGVTIFTLGFGFDADMDFLKKISLANDGFARRIYEDSDASIQLQNFYKEVASPVLSDIKFEYVSDQVEEVTSEGFKNLFSGSEVLVLGKVKPNATLSGNLVANSRSGVQRMMIPIDDIVLLPPCCKKVTVKSFGHLEKMWAYKTIKSLLDKNTVSKNDTIKNKAKELALKYSFVTPLTSLIVVKPNITEVGTLNTEGPNGPAYGSGGGGFLGFGGGGFASGPAGNGGGFRRGAARKGMPAGGALYSLTLAAPAPPMYPGMARPMAPMYPGSAIGFGSPSFMKFNRRPVKPLFDSSHHAKGTTFRPAPLLDSEDATIQPAATISPPELVPHQNVTWLNQTATDEGYLVPPSSLPTNDVIALNETNIAYPPCANGNPCRHFIFCVLKEFADDVSTFAPFQCHIEPKFLGVCCPV